MKFTTLTSKVIALLAAIASYSQALPTPNGTMYNMTEPLAAGVADLMSVVNNTAHEARGSDQYQADCVYWQDAFDHYYITWDAPYTDHSVCNRLFMRIRNTDKWNGPDMDPHQHDPPYITSDTLTGFDYTGYEGLEPDEKQPDSEQPAKEKRKIWVNIDQWCCEKDPLNGGFQVSFKTTRELDGDVVRAMKFTFGDRPFRCAAAGDDWKHRPEPQRFTETAERARLGCFSKVNW